MDLFDLCVLFCGRIDFVNFTLAIDSQEAHEDGHAVE